MKGEESALCRVELYIDRAGERRLRAEGYARWDFQPSRVWPVDYWQRGKVRGHGGKEERHAISGYCIIDIDVLRSSGVNAGDEVLGLGTMKMPPTI